jgi:hypothetical protein
VSTLPFVSNPSLADSGENSRNVGELPGESANTNNGIRVSDTPLDMELTLKDHKRFKHAKDVPPDAVIQFLKPSMLGQNLVHDKHVLTLPSSFLNEPIDMFGEVKMVAAKAYSIKQFWYIDYEFIAPDAKRLQYRGRTCQVPIIRGTAKSTAHNANVVNLYRFTKHPLHFLI